MVIKKHLDADVLKLDLPPKAKRIIQCFLEIECESDVDHTPQQAKALRAKIIHEVVLDLENPIFYDEEEKRRVPLWHRLFISARDTEGRSKELRYLLRCLGRLLKNCDNRRSIYH